MSYTDMSSYRICSCGSKLSTKSRQSIRDHRRAGHTIPLKSYRGISTGIKNRMMRKERGE